MKKSLIRKSVEKFIHTESSSGIMLAFCALAALLLANSPFAASYFQFLERELFGLSVQLWINDGLMAVFFFVVGLEIKREITNGELSTLRSAALPVAAAVGGMVVPALIYTGFNGGGPDAAGWAVPMATDIAFALAVLTLFGKRIPLSLKIFLLALAIVDDLGAVLVIAFFYTAQIKWLGLAAAAATLVLVFIARRFAVAAYWVYVLFGIGAWGGFLYSGVHPTVAGVLLGLFTPYMFNRRGQVHPYSPIDELIHLLHPWVSFLIMPVFALANAGIALSGIDAGAVFTDPVTLGVALGLIAGKPAGILFFSWLVVATGAAVLPRDLRWPQLAAVSILAGIGFTMSIFIANLALVPEKIVLAKAGIMVASLAAAVIGGLVLSRTLRPPSDS